MGEVITVPIWGNSAKTNNVSEKFLACDQFIRSKVVPPPLGSIVFSFMGGRVTITGDLTHISGGDCEITIRGGKVWIIGSPEYAATMHCAIHREIEEIRATELARQIAAH